MNEQGFLFDGERYDTASLQLAAAGEIPLAPDVDFTALKKKDWVWVEGWFACVGRGDKEKIDHQGNAISEARLSFALQPVKSSIQATRIKTGEERQAEWDAEHEASA